MTDIRNAPFYPGMLEDAQKDQVRASVMWPIVLTLHFNTVGKIYVTDIEAEADGYVREIFMRTQQGGHVLRIYKSKVDEEIYINLSYNMFDDNVYRHNLVFSKDPRYIIKSLGKDSENIKTINQHIITRDQILPDVIQKLTQMFYHHVMPKDVYRNVDMSYESQETALRLLCGGQPRTEVDQDSLKKIMAWWGRIQEHD